MSQNKAEIKIKKGPYSCFFKRLIDFTASLIAIVLLSPVFIITILLSLVFIGGNPFFMQRRPGKNGKIFNFVKFRSMTNKKDKEGNLLPDDKRMTKWGKIIRKLSLDELPQLFNILAGSMSIVGPRPRLIKDMIFYDKELIEKAYCVKPGLTGPAQVYDRNSEKSWEEVFKRDIEYAKNVTFINDVKMIFGTVGALFKGGADRGDESETKIAKEKQKREYYYPDQLLKDKVITEAEYKSGLEKAKALEAMGKFLELQVVNNKKEKI